MLQAVAGLLLIAGAAATWRQVHISREGQITERLTRAVEQIGSDNVDVRIGGIYALERISKNSATDRNAIQFILGAFVRNHAAWPVGTPGGPEHSTAQVDEHLPWLRVRSADVQAALEVLARRPASPEERQLYLSRVDLRGLSLEGAMLRGTQMHYANLARSWLRAARLDASDLKGTDLRRAYLEDAHLAGRNLSNSTLQGADLRGADLNGANLSGADLRDVNLDRTVLSGARADAATQWPAPIDADRRNQLGVLESAPELGPAAGAAPEPGA